MGERKSDTREHAIRRALVGVALVLVGGLTLGFLVFVSNSQSSGAEHLMMSLGLAGSALLSAIAQGLVFLGGWMLWKSAHRRAR
jgi:high-affinity Fe2+/Pb2+ permease